MDNTRKTKVALMAAASLLAGAAALSPASASDVDQAAFPTTIEAPVVHAGADQAVDQGDKDKAVTARQWALLAAAAGALAGLVKLIGARKIVRVAGKAAGKAARISGKAAAGAGRVVGRAVASPLRFAALMTGLAVFSLTGLWLFDLEWMGGLIAGAAMAGVGAYGVMKTRGIFKRAKVLN